VIPLTVEALCAEMRSYRNLRQEMGVEEDNDSSVVEGSGWNGGERQFEWAREGTARKKRGEWVGSIKLCWGGGEDNRRS